jgi:hypothetical protein
MLKADLEDRVTGEYRNAMGYTAQRKINPETIQLIITTVMALIQKCSANQIKKNVESHPFITRLMISRALPENSLTRKDLNEIHDSIENLGMNATLAEIKNLQTKGIE